MIVCRTIEHFRTERSKLGGTLGLVPTMGFLHQGHLALVAASQAHNDHTTVSIFVNPAQFNSSEDLAAYPRDEQRDLAMLEAQKVDLIFMPPREAMYPVDFQTYINVEQVSQGLEGEYRPGHFKGVATVVAKLFNVVQPDRAYFGQKDAQQVAVIKQMVRDLQFPLEIMVFPTQREPDGLAMSSRNARLNEIERKAATVLHKALSEAKSAYDSGEKSPQKLLEIARNIVLTEPLAKIDYVSIDDANTLKPFSGEIDAPALISMAVFIGAVRLIDNFILDAPVVR